jgi:hypothetical protein
MKRFPAVLICVLALLANACEQHKASELEGAHPAETHPDPKFGTTQEHPEKAKHEEKQATDAAHGGSGAGGTKPATPTFFPGKQ